MPIGFLVDNEGPPASLDEMARDNAGDSALIEKLRRMKVGDVIRVGGGGAAGVEIKAVSMSAPTAEALAYAIHAARSSAVRMAIPVEDTPGFPGSVTDINRREIRIGRKAKAVLGYPYRREMVGTVERVWHEPGDPRWWVLLRLDDDNTTHKVASDKLDMV